MNGVSIVLDDCQWRSKAALTCMPVFPLRVNRGARNRTFPGIKARDSPRVRGRESAGLMLEEKAALVSALAKDTCPYQIELLV